MKTFNLTETEIKFISDYFPGINLNDKLLQKSNVFVLRLDASEQKKFTDRLTDLLISTGLDKNDEPNKIGLQIERLIDIFNPYK